MKYLFACLVISTAHLVFALAFTLCALSIGAATLTSKLKRGKIPD